MDLEFTRYSAGRLRTRKVQRTEVEMAIDSPDQVVDTDTSHVGYIKALGGGEWLTVIVDPNTSPLVVVTLWVDPPRR
jgi:hypothetical protein